MRKGRYSQLVTGGGISVKELEDRIQALLDATGGVSMTDFGTPPTPRPSKARALRKVITGKWEPTND